MKRFLAIIGSVAALLAAALPAWAHEQKASITSVTFNERSGNLEFVHRFSFHDAEHVVQLLNGNAASIHETEGAQKDFANYVVSEFVVRKLDNTPIDLALVGYELDSGFIWIYQEAAVEADLEGLRLRHSALHSYWPKQINTVNIELEDSVQTIVFTSGDGLRDVIFQAPLQISTGGAP